MSRPPLRDLFRLVNSGLEKVALACAAFGLMHATARAGESTPPSIPAEEQWGSHATPRPITDDAWSNPAATSLDHDDAWSAPPADHFRSVEQIRVAAPAPAVSKTVQNSAAIVATKAVATEAVATKAAAMEAASTVAPNALAMDHSDWNETPRGRAPGLIASNDAWRNRAAPKEEQAVEPGAAKHDANGQPAASSGNNTFLQIDPWSAPASASVASNGAARSAPAAAPKPFDASSQWRFAVSPYIWLPSVSGTTRFTGSSVAEGFGSRSVDAQVGPQDLKFASMIQGEARKGDWSVFADTVFLSFGKHGASANAAGKNEATPGALSGAETAMRGAMAELGAGFTIFRQSRMLIDAIGGVRYLGANVTLDATFDQPGGGTRDAHTSQSQNIVNGFAGVRGRIAMTQDGRWYVPFYLDAGAGTSKVTWQAMTGIGYVMKWADVNLVYRYLAFHGSSDQLMQTVRMNGPSLGATFRF